MRALAFLLLIWALPVQAIELIQLDLADIRGEGWQASKVSLRVDLLENGRLGLQLKAGRFQHLASAYRATDIHLSCTALQLEQHQARCRRGQLSLKDPQLGRLKAALSFQYALDGSNTRIRLTKLRLVGGTLAVSLSQQAADWSAMLKLQQADITAVKTLLEKYAKPLKPLSATGSLNAELTVNGQAGQWQSLVLKGGITQLNLENADGTVASEALQSEIDLKLKNKGSVLQYQAEVRMNSGGLYVEPLYLAPEKQALALSMAGVLSGDHRQLQVERWRWQHPGVVELVGSGSAQLQPSLQLQSLKLDSVLTELAPIAANYLQPFLIDTPLEEAEMTGKAALSVALDGQWRANLLLDDVGVQANRADAAVEGLSGSLAWQESGEGQASSLGWRKARYQIIDIGAADMDFLSVGKSVRQLKPLNMPVFDGRLVLYKGVLTDMGTDDMTVSLDASLQPLSMEKLTQAMGWPDMAGQVSAMVPDIRYGKGRLDVGGAVLLKVFDGDIVMRNLALSGLGSSLPQLRGDISIRSLDLETLTRTFSFGKIEGRLHGGVDELLMEDWQPVAFDARFFTRDEDDVRRRVSQRAVDNLSRVGGGIGGLSGVFFLGLFEDFGYKRLGLSCRLENGTCYMNGIEAADNGYYIVRGSGIPHLDVKGFNHQVNWQSLVERLKTISTMGAPQVK